MACLPSGQEWAVIVLLAMIVFGASRLPQIADSLGRSVRNFKRGLRGEHEIDVTPKKKIDSGEKKEE